MQSLSIYSWVRYLHSSIYCRKSGYYPGPFDIATCMYHTGFNPFTGEEVSTAKHLRDRKLQRALLQFFKPENHSEVREALQKAVRQDPIGSGCDALIPANPPKIALQARMAKANKSVTEGRYVHTITPEPRPSLGYRPQRQTARRRPGRNKFKPRFSFIHPNTGIPTR